MASYHPVRLKCECGMCLPTRNRFYVERSAQKPVRMFGDLGKLQRRTRCRRTGCRRPTAYCTSTYYDGVCIRTLRWHINKHAHKADFKLKATSHAVEERKRAAARELHITDSMVRKQRKQAEDLPSKETKRRSQKNKAEEKESDFFQNGFVLSNATYNPERLLVLKPGYVCCKGHTALPLAGLR